MSASLRSAKFFFFLCALQWLSFFNAVVCMGGSTLMSGGKSISFFYTKKTGSTTDLNLELPDVISEQRMQESNASGVESSVSH